MPRGRTYQLGIHPRFLEAEISSYLSLLTVRGIASGLTCLSYVDRVWLMRLLLVGLELMYPWGRRGEVWLVCNQGLFQ